MKIYIIRHAEPDYSIDSLTTKGWYESELLSDRLSKLKIDAVYCSPFGRAQDTAKYTLEKLNMKAETLPWLAEFRGSIPPMANHNQTTIPWDIHPTLWEDKEELFHRNNWTESNFLSSGNSAEIYEETKKGFDALLEEYGYKKEGLIYKCNHNDDTNIVLICHFALGSALIGYLAGVSPFIMWHSFFMPPSSVTTIVSSEVKRGEVFLRCMQIGDTSHLYAAGEPISCSGLLPEIYEAGNIRNLD